MLAKLRIPVAAAAACKAKYAGDVKLITPGLFPVARLGPSNASQMCRQGKVSRPVRLGRGLTDTVQIGIIHLTL